MTRLPRNRFPLIEFSSKQFTVTDGGKSLCAEASELFNRHLQPIYNDACDVGLAIKSERTGAVVVYVMSRPVFRDDIDHELTHWEYEPADFSVRQFPDCAGTKLTVFNE